MESKEHAAKPIQSKSIKCVVCLKDVQKPAQLTECLHVVCEACLDDLKKGTIKSYVVCVKCQTESLDPRILPMTSGITDDVYDTEAVCGNCERPAQYNCFKCYMYLCAPCWTHHDRDHPFILVSGLNLLREPASGHMARDHADAPSNAVCPLSCPHQPCQHQQLLLDLDSPVDVSVGNCDISTHMNKCDGRQHQRRFFCKNDHWRPVCEDCSERGEHKLCNTTDVVNMLPHINSTIDETLEHVRILFGVCQDELAERELVELDLRNHFKKVERDIIERRDRILQFLEKAFQDIVEKGKKTGNDILDQYQVEICPLRDLDSFLTRLMPALQKLKLDPSTVDTPKFVNSFELQKKANSLLLEFEKFIKENGVFDGKRLDEMRMVLPSVPDSISIPPLLVNVCREHRHPRFDFNLNVSFDFQIDSFIVTGKHTCMYIEQTLHSSKMVKLEHNKSRQETEIKRGKYHFARMNSGEIVATCMYDPGHKQDYRSEIVYHSGMVFNGPSLPKRVEFKTIYPNDNNRMMPVKGIAVTEDNSVLVCVNLHQDDSKKNETDPHSYLMAISLQGTFIRRSEPCLDSAMHVAVSKFGEIAVSDPEGHQVVIMDRDFNIVKKIPYPLATSMNHSRFQPTTDGSGDRFSFSPQGLCFDSFGRLIVTDPNNDSIVRLSRNARGEFVMEPLIVHRGDLKDFVGPHLVAIGPGEKLWVVCKRDIFVFHYRLF